MAKRARSSGGSVTGGTGDIKPQILTIDTGVAGAIDDYVTDRIPLPVPRFGAMKTKATVFEFLWVEWYPAIEDIADDVSTHVAFLSTTQTRASGDATSLANFALDAAEPRNFGMVLNRRSISTNGGQVFSYPLRIDLTDHNGNGILIATDSIVITGGGAGNAAAGSYVAKIGYRLVNIGVTEYVGIVQSQQAT